jgi:hypothetical protein
MVYFQTKNRNLVKFWRALQWKKLVNFMDIWSISWPFYIVYGNLANFVVIWYIFPCFCILYQEKSGNPAVPRCSTNALIYVCRTTVFWKPGNVKNVCVAPKVKKLLFKISFRFFAVRLALLKCWKNSDHVFPPTSNSCQKMSDYRVTKKNSPQDVETFLQSFIYSTCSR